MRQCLVVLCHQLVQRFIPESSHSFVCLFVSRWYASSHSTGLRLIMAFFHTCSMLCKWLLCDYRSRILKKKKLSWLRNGHNAWSSLVLQLLCMQVYLGMSQQLSSGCIQALPVTTHRCCVCVSSFASTRSQTRCDNAWRNTSRWAITANPKNTHSSTVPSENTVTNARWLKNSSVAILDVQYLI